MKSVRTYSLEPREAEEGSSPPRLHLVSPSAPPRPTWGLLYVVLGVIAVAGAAAHFLSTDPVVRRVLDAGLGFACFVALAGWVHFNRVALTQVDEPEAGAVRPRVRIVRSRARSAHETYADDGVVRLDPDERVILPYDFK